MPAVIYLLLFKIRSYVSASHIYQYRFILAYYNPYGVRWRQIPAVDVRVSNCCQGIIMRYDNLWPIGQTAWIVWRRHQMETFSALLVLCAGNSPVTGEFPSQGTVTRSFDVFFDPYLNKRLSKQSRAWWFETPSRPLLRHCNRNSRSPYCHRTRSNSGCTRVIVEPLCFEQCLLCHYDPWTPSDLIIPDSQFPFAL